MPVEVFISRPVHDQLLENYPSLMEEIFLETDQKQWTLAGVKVTMYPAVHRSYVGALNGLVVSLSSKVKEYEHAHCS